MQLQKFRKIKKSSDFVLYFVSYGRNISRSSVRQPPPQKNTNLLVFYGDGLMGMQNVIKCYIGFENGDKNEPSSNSSTELKASQMKERM